MKRVIALALAAVLLLAGCVEDVGTVSEISSSEARAIAIADAGVDEARLESVAAALAERDGIRYYDVSFSTGEVIYEYDVDALTGVVIASEYAVIITLEDGTTLAEPLPIPDRGTPTAEQLDNVDVPTSVEPDALFGSNGTPSAEPTPDPSCTTPVPPTPEPQPTSAPEPSAEPSVIPVHFAEESLEPDVYYIVEPSSEPNGGEAGIVLTPAKISEQRAKEIALAQVSGATTSDIYDFEIDYDDGRLEYEGKIIYDEMEYEFEIDGYSGAIRSWEVESIYD